jgi:hypothetical protein
MSSSVGCFCFLQAPSFIYSWYFYPDTHPIDCAIRQHTGKDCPTCGFSRSFSLYTHFQFKAGRDFNPRSFPVFLFFGLQFLMRGFVIARYYFTRKNLAPAYIKSDVLISISGFLLAFLPLILKT